MASRVFGTLMAVAGGAQGEAESKRGDGMVDLNTDILGEAARDMSMVIGAGRGNMSTPLATVQESDEEIRALLVQKESDLVLAAELGKALLEKNEELRRQNEELEKEFREKIEVSESLRLREEEILTANAIVKRNEMTLFNEAKHLRSRPRRQVSRPL